MTPTEKEVHTKLTEFLMVSARPSIDSDAARALFNYPRIGMEIPKGDKFVAFVKTLGFTVKKQVKRCYGGYPQLSYRISL